MVRLVPIFAVLAIATGCKSMGGFASGLGHAASGLGHVASGIGRATSGLGHVASGLGKVAHVASGAGKIVVAAGKITGATLAHAAPAVAKTTVAVARATSNVAPIVETVAEAALTSPMPMDPYVEEGDATEHVTPLDGPLIDDHDPCNRCPDDLSCDQCIGFNDVVCRYTPPGAHTRCESSN